MKSTLVIASTIALSLAIMLSSVRAESAVWDSANTAAATAGGTLGDVSIGMSEVRFVSVGGWDLSGPDFSVAPGASVQQILAYSVGSDWSATFSKPVGGLMLYAGAWRSATYTFDRPFTVVSGFSGATVAGSVLTLPEPDFHNGILRFNDPVSSVSVVSSRSDIPQQALTFGIIPVPEPATLPLAILAMFALGIGHRWIRGPRGSPIEDDRI
jgi:hypothetical protein